MLTYFGHSPCQNRPSFAEQPNLRTVRNYWESLRNNGALPRRDQIDPRGMASSLDKVFLIERVTKGHARFRLAGMHLGDIMGMDLRGMPLSALFEPGDRARVAVELEQAFDIPAVMEISLEADGRIGCPPMSAQMLLLPLADGAGAPGLALGCLVSHGRLGRAPRRFKVRGIVRCLINSPMLRVLENPAIADRTAPPWQTGKPMLRVVK